MCAAADVEASGVLNAVAGVHAFDVAADDGVRASDVAADDDGVRASDVAAADDGVDACVVAGDDGEDDACGVEGFKSVMMMMKKMTVALRGSMTSLVVLMILISLVMLDWDPVVKPNMHEVSDNDHH